MRVYLNLKIVSRFDFSYGVLIFFFFLFESCSPIPIPCLHILLVSFEFFLEGLDFKLFLLQDWSILSLEFNDLLLIIAFQSFDHIYIYSLIWVSNLIDRVWFYSSRARLCYALSSFICASNCLIWSWRSSDLFDPSLLSLSISASISLILVWSDSIYLPRESLSSYNWVFFLLSEVISSVLSWMILFFSSIYFSIWFIFCWYIDEEESELFSYLDFWSSRSLSSY